MRFEIYPPVLRNNVLSHAQRTSPYFTMEPRLFGRTARHDFPIVLDMGQFDKLYLNIKKLLMAESCRIFAVSDEGQKQQLTVEMMDEYIKGLSGEAEEDLPVAPPADPPAPPAPPAPVEVPKAEVVETSGPAVEIPAPLMTPPAEAPVAEAAPAVEAPVTEEPKAEEPAPVVEEPTKKKGKGKKTE